MKAPAPDSALLQVKVQPRASRTEVSGFDGEVLKVRVTAPPADGEANEMLLALLARSFGCPRSAVTLVQGARSRNKLVRLRGLSLSEIRERFSLAGSRRD